MSTPARFWLGAPVALVGSGLYLLGASRVGRLKAPSTYSLELDTSGIYSWVRHPQALSLSLLVVSIGLISGSVPLLVSVPLWVGCWIAYTYFEEELELVPAFGEQYLAYRDRTPRLWPHLQRARDGAAKLLSEIREARDVS